MKLRYSSPAPLQNEFAYDATDSNSWETHSLPIGNGFFGANIFGRTITERIQISEPTLVNPWLLKDDTPDKVCSAGGVNNFAEILLDFNHQNITNYERGLDLQTACAYVNYECGGVKYFRKAFTSFVDKVLVVNLQSSKKNSLNFDISLTIPFLQDYTVKKGDGFTKSGSVVVENDKFLLNGKMGFYNIEFSGVLKVVCKDGQLLLDNNKICVKKATEVNLIFSCDTNYKLCEHIFYESNPKNKLQGNKVDKQKLYSLVDFACSLGYKKLLKRHLKDYKKLYNSMQLDLKEESTEYTDKLLQEYKNGKQSKYLQVLLYQYGRYLLISSSRTRLPTHLQGIWNCYASSPWSCGYWHNINIQMNYWASYSTGLAETFIPYINYAKAFMKKTREFADLYVKNNHPENYGGQGQNGWIIGTGCSAYHIEGFDRVYHSGPGTGAFTALMFWDYFDYTRDINFLKEFGYPALKGMSLFFSKILVEIDGKYLIKESASPENEHNGKYYHTSGCAFDQQMVYENFKRTIEASEILGLVDDFILKLKEMLPHLDPVLIGDDGQIKEYREETTYSSIGDPLHRHVSHLVGLYPGTLINSTTPDWIKGASISLEKRGKGSSGWSIAHRLLMWARIKNGEKCKELIDYFICTRTNPNLWTIHPPFQIDGNFGYTASISEILLQSQSGYLELLPSIPNSWDSGEFKGLVARGNFVVSCKWKKGKIIFVKVISKQGGKLNIKLPTHLLPKGYSEIFSKDTKVNEIITFK